MTARENVLTLPTLPYAYFPAFVHWEGSVSVSHQHFTSYVRDILECYVRFGVKKFLIIDGGVSTHPPLCLMARDMNNELGVKVAVTDITQLAKDAEADICSQPRGGHGDEAETSTLLYIREDLVHMDKTVEEYTQPWPGSVSKWAHSRECSVPHAHANRNKWGQHARDQGKGRKNPECHGR